MNRLIRGLGYFSIALGAAELIAPGFVARLIGVNESPKMLRSCGARELAAGAGILSGRNTTQWLWSRVAGDVVDLSSLGLAMRKSRRPLLTAAALAAVADVTFLDVKTALARPVCPPRARAQAQAHAHARGRVCADPGISLPARGFAAPNP